MNRTFPGLLLIVAIGLLLSPQEAGAGRESYDLDSVVVVFPQDGRPAQPVPRVTRGIQSYLPLGPLARALGVPFTWDPYTYRGWLATDSVRTRFTFDSPVLSHGDEGIQLDAAVSYDAQGVLIPIDYLSVLAERWHGERVVSWRPVVGVFRWGVDVPTFRQIQLASLGHRTTMRIPLAREPASTLLWSPLGGIEVRLEGQGLHPESLSIGSPRGLFAVREVRGTPTGSRIRLTVSPEALGAEASYDAGEHDWELAATTSPQEIARGGFRLLQPVDQPDPPMRGGPVLVTCWTDSATDPAEAVHALDDLADRIVHTLSDTLAQPAERLQSHDPLDDASCARTEQARCVIALRLDGYATGVGKVQIWSPMPRYQWVPLARPAGAKSDENVPQPLLWSEAPALAAAETEKLAAMLADHLASSLGSDRVQRGQRPSRWLEGFTMPAVLIYPAQADDLLSLERLMNPDERAGLARAIAFGIAEALAGAWTEEGLP